MSDTDLELAMKLKDEGNKLFANREFTQAYAKYTSAIKKCGNNAILYANRAACSISMEKYLDASTDAKKATELDPTYIKAWGRLGTAEQELGSWDRAKEAYENALSRLPQQGLSPAERKLKGQYEDALKTAKRKLEPRALDHVVTSSREQEGHRPWDRAQLVLSTLRAEGREGEKSSAWVVVKAFEEFDSASVGLKSIAHVRLPNGQLGATGCNTVLDDLTNAILRDRRVFHISDPKWLQNYQLQVIIEANITQAWKEAGPEVVFTEAQDRIRTRGWDATRHAISTTVRAWIMRAFLAAGLNQDYSSAIQFYGNAIEFLERGRKVWRNVSRDDRGTVFDETFIRGIRSLQLEAYMSGYAKSGGSDRRFSLDTLWDLAKSLYEDTEKAEKQANESEFACDPGFFLSFYVYPAAEALAMMAFCQKSRSKGKPSAEHSQLFGESATFYWMAAQKYPDDDELCGMYITTALDEWWKFDDCPVKTLLPLLSKLKDAAPKIKHIWKFSAAAAGGLEARINRCLDAYEVILKKLKSGQLTEDQPFVPSFAK